ncbi:hypothetical protein JOB18_006737 [Solea senegalensis]|uniref:Uncharacterized protein n=1 Tax=Solea senegalensis TaxID=28829 RepID=A0AAV6T423_SOLSE|nr:hypothetical protein JOB18_006737 [Solea senegalensis]
MARHYRTLSLLTSRPSDVHTRTRPLPHTVLKGLFAHLHFSPRAAGRNTPSLSITSSGSSHTNQNNPDYFHVPLFILFKDQFVFRMHIAYASVQCPVDIVVLNLDFISL